MSYDGVFEFECEKEFFYLECATRSIREEVVGPPECHNLIKGCRISRNLSLLRFMLCEHGK